MSWIDEFNTLAINDDLIFVHQKAGWKDIKDIDIWNEFVKEVTQDFIKDGMSIFEPGCGVCAFLLTLKKMYPNISIYGFDTAINAINFIKNNLPDSEKDHFTIGEMPKSFENIESNAYDIVLSNSVFQYLPNLETAQKVVSEMIRICKNTGTVIISDICDTVTSHLNEERMTKLWDNYGTPERPKFLYFSQDWFLQFETSNVKVTFKRIQDERYIRRTERYNVYLTLDKNL